MPTDALPENAPAAPSPAAAVKKSNVPAGYQSTDGNIKETIESILVAFILAFIFRAYVVEAFVIPTGSMAPTLLGAHMRFQCIDCGYRFTVNYSGQAIGDDVIIPSFATLRGKDKTFGIVCPNCGKQVPERLSPNAKPGSGDEVGDPGNDATAPPVYYGDRILVLKYAFLLNDPRRWDVVVFKTPHGDRSVPPYTMNYIKRLVGKPLESLKILDGDVYVARYDPDHPEKKPADADYKIQRKSAVAQSDLWRIVCDNDYLPKRPMWTQPWKAELSNAGWTLEQNGKPAREFTFNNASGDGWIRFDASSDEERVPLTDWLAYDITQRQQSDRFREPEPQNTSELKDYGLGGTRRAVSDLKISCTYTRTSGDGALKLELEKLRNVMTAEITNNKVRLVLHAADGATTEAGPVAFPSGSKPVRLDFSNVDYRAALRVDGTEVLSLEYAPNVTELMAAYHSNTRLPLPRVRIGSERQSCTISHLSLWRDIYYTNDMPSPNWGSPDTPVNLGRDEFFVLGDNSIMSGDARVFSSRVSLPAEDLEVESGRVPGRFMLGKAFFVYWPAGYRPIDGGPGLIPNFAEMRFIH